MRIVCGRSLFCFCSEINDDDDEVLLVMVCEFVVFIGFVVEIVFVYVLLLLFESFCIIVEIVV